MIFLWNLFWLLVSHAVCDYALQSEDMIELKSPETPPDLGHGPWWWTMLAHSIINGGGVALVTGSILLGVGETVVHFLTDTFKCMGVLNANEDQFIHIVSKVVWALSAALFLKVS